METCAVTLKVLNEVEKLCHLLEEQGDEYFIAAVTHENNFLHTGSTKGRQFLENNPNLTHCIGYMFMTHCYGKRKQASELPLEKTFSDLSDINSYGGDFSYTMSRNNNQTCDNYCENSMKETEVKKPVTFKIYKHGNDEGPECENTLLKDSVVQNTKEATQCQMNQDVSDKTKSTNQSSTFKETTGDTSVVTKVKLESDVFEIEWGGNKELYEAENSEANAYKILQKSHEDALIAPESIKKEIEDTEFHPSISKQQTIVRSPISEKGKERIDRTLRNLLMTDSSELNLTRSDIPVMAVTNDNELRSGAFDSTYTTVEVCASSDKRNNSFAILNVPTTFTPTPLPYSLKAAKRVTKQKQPEQANYRSLITGNLVKVVNRDEGNTLDVEKRDMLVANTKGAGAISKTVPVLDMEWDIVTKEKPVENSSTSGDSMHCKLKLMARRLIENQISKHSSETEKEQDSVSADKQNVSLINVKKEPYWETEIITNDRIAKVGMDSNELRQGEHKCNIGNRATADLATEFPRTSNKMSDSKSKVGNCNFQIKVKEEPKWEVSEEEMFTNEVPTTDTNLITKLTIIDKKRSTQDNLQQVSSLPGVKGKYDDFFDELASSIKTEQELNHDRIDNVHHTDDLIRQSKEMVCKDKQTARMTMKNKISTETQVECNDEGYKIIQLPVFTVFEGNAYLPGYNQKGNGSKKKEKAGKQHEKANPEYHSKRKTKKRETKNPPSKVTSQGKGEEKNRIKEINSERGISSVKECDIGDHKLTPSVANVGINSEVFENTDAEEMYMSYSYDNSEQMCCAIDQASKADHRVCDATNQEVNNDHDFENSYQPSCRKKRKVLGSNSSMEYMSNVYEASTQDTLLKSNGRKRKSNNSVGQITNKKSSSQGIQLDRTQIPSIDEDDREEEDIFSQILQSKDYQDILEESLSVPSSPSFESSKTPERKSIKKSSNLSDKDTDSSAGAQFRSISNFIENAQKRHDNTKRRRKMTDTKSKAQHTSIKKKEKIVPEDKGERAEPPTIPRIVTYTSLLTGKVMAIDSYSVAKPP